MHPDHHHKPQSKEVINITENIVIIEGQHYHKGNPEIKIIGELVHIVNKLIPIKPQKPIFALTIFINNQFFLMANVNLVLGVPKTGVFTLLDASLNPLTGVTFSNQVVGANSNPEFASFALDGGNPNNLIATPIATGSGTIVVSTDASYTDPSSGQPVTASFSITKNYTVSATGTGVTFDIVFP